MKNKNNQGFLPASPYIIWSSLFIVIPLLIVIFFAFTTKSGDTYKFSLENFQRLLDTNYLKVFGRSILLAAEATLGCLILGYPVAYLISKMREGKRNVLIMLFIVPMWINFTLRIAALKEVLTFIEGNLAYHPFLNTIIGMTYDFLPFMILPIYNALEKLDGSLLEASRDLGANEVETFTKVTLPLSVPGIISGITMVFLPAMTNYVVLDMLYNSTYIMGSLIGSYFSAYNWHGGSMIALILLAIICLFTLLTTEPGEENERGGALL